MDAILYIFIPSMTKRDIVGQTLNVQLIFSLILEMLLTALIKGQLC